MVTIAGVGDGDGVAMGGGPFGGALAHPASCIAPSATPAQRIRRPKSFNGVIRKLIYEATRMAAAVPSRDWSCRGWRAKVRKAPESKGREKWKPWNTEQPSASSAATS